MGLHNHILESSDELKSDISDFAKIAHLASAKPQMLWPTLSARDAPRALSDTLLAVAAAVFLDTNWSTFHKLFDSVFKVHVLDTMFHDQMTSADGGLAASGDPVAHLQRLAGSAGLSMEVRSAGRRSLPTNQTSAVARPSTLRGCRQILLPYLRLGYVTSTYAACGLKEFK